MHLQDSAIVRELQGLRGEMTRGFDSVDNRIDRIETKFDKVVTQAEFGAVVARLDLKDTALEGAMNSGFNSVNIKVGTVVSEIKEADKERNVKNRWFWGLIVSCAGIISGVVFGIISNFLV